VSDRMLHTLAALKVIAYGGPVALALSTIGSVVLGFAFFDKAGEHYDVLVVGGVTLVVLGWVEIALARRFHAHEEVEKRQYEYVAAIADSAAQSLTEITKATREHTASVEGFRADVGAVRVDLAALTGRVKLIEDRYMRPGLVLPRQPGGND
jgi:hypothetical protein